VYDVQSFTFEALSNAHGNAGPGVGIIKSWTIYPQNGRSPRCGFRFGGHARRGGSRNAVCSIGGVVLVYVIYGSEVGSLLRTVAGETWHLPFETAPWPGCPLYEDNGCEK
jgi:hypothetical protein